MIGTRGRHPAVAGVLCTVVLSLYARVPIAAQAWVTESAVKDHIEHLTSLLVERQRPDGSWTSGGYTAGLTALVVLALKHAGLPKDHPAVARGVAYVVRNSDGKVYSESLTICALQEVGPEAYRNRIEEAVRFLARSQTARGSWSYPSSGRAGDNSNAQFAVLGLAAAERCGVAVPERVKQRAKSHWLTSQGRDGGWSYRRGSGSSTLSMTCAGVASLHLLGRVHEKPGPTCGDYEQDTSLARGLAAILRQIGGQPRQGYQGAYALYALERVGMFLDLKKIGGLDWYRWGAAQILGQMGQKSTSDQAFDLLFLAKGKAQIAIAKWQWDGDWNNDRFDVRNWVALSSKELKMKLDWIPARLDQVDAAVLKASMIFVSGHERFAAGGKAAIQLQGFLARKGTLVAEGCCDSEVFVDSFKEFVLSELYPKVPVEFSEVTSAHPVCQHPYALTGDDVSALEAKTGCHRRRILILKRDISCALNGERCDAREKERALKLAVNLLAWAVQSKSPKGKLAAVKPQDGDRDRDRGFEREPAEATRRYRQPFGRLVHRGEWDVDLAFFPTLRRALAPVHAVPHFDGEVFVNPRSDDLFASAVLYVTGHEAPKLRREEWLPLREYLQNGGNLVATACCGLDAFDHGFRVLLRNVLPNDRLEEIPPDDAVWKTPYDRTALEAVGSRAYVRRYGKKLAPLYAVRRAGRWIVFYSPVDLCCDLEGDLDEESVAYKKRTSVLIWANVLHYLSTP